MNENVSLVQLGEATRTLASIRTVDDAAKIIDMAEAARVYARQAHLGLEAQNYAAEIKIRAQRRAGEILQSMDLQKGRPIEKMSQPSTFSEPKLDDMGITRNQSSSWQAIASLPEDVFEQAITETKDDSAELTTAQMLRIAKDAPHVSYNTGNHEWYTPPEYILAARSVLGGIDLDPASSDKANEIVGAAVYYTKQDDGLTKDWAGTVWMNPPYASPLIGLFAVKLRDSFLQGGVTEAIALVNNATETNWFLTLAEAASAIVFPSGRVRFLDEQGNPGAPLQGQAIIYMGPTCDDFLDDFAAFGWGARL